MAELQLTEEMTCSICLELFHHPVTIPCGHNFCSPCLNETWTVQGPPFYCPQCRTSFLTRPQLQKNTALCSVVDHLQQIQSRQELGSLCEEAKRGESWDLPSRKEGQGKEAEAVSVACDHCLQAPAAKTCFTCMASFCQEHLRPHLDNPAFQGHALQQPVPDLARRKCAEHSRLREFFCPQHGACICCVCLVGHKTCSPVALDIARNDLKSKMKQKLTTAYDDINKASSALKDVKLKQLAVQETAARKIDLLKREYEEMKTLIESEEKRALRKLKEEEKRVLDKYDYVHQVLLKKKKEIEFVKEEIELLLTKDDEIAFLEKASKLQEILIKSVYVPKNELNQEMINGVYQHAFSLKEALKHNITHLQEKKTEEATSSDDSGKPSSSFRPAYPTKDHYQTRRIQKGDKPQPKAQGYQQEKSGVTEQKQEKKPRTSTPVPAATPSQKPSLGTMPDLADLKTALSDTTEKGAAALPKNSPTRKTQILETFLAKSRPELLQSLQPQQPPQLAAQVKGREILIASCLAAVSPKQRKQVLGECLFRLIQTTHSSLAGKLTGMLLELDNSEILHLLESPESLHSKVKEAIAVLQAHHAKKKMMMMTTT